MKILLPFLMVLVLLISGCGSSESESCFTYCDQQPHAECVGEWQVGGMYPDCTCEFICHEGRDDAVEAEPVEAEQPICTNECNSTGCLGSKHYDCMLKTDGCKDKAELKIIKGECGVECMSNSDCSGQECTAYKCKAATSSLDLKSLPKPFSDDGILVVGAKAPATDVAAAMEISSMLVFEGGKKFDLKMDNQISDADYSHNLILIGNPCDNSMIEKVFGIVCNGLSLNNNQAMLKLADSRGKAALLISGKTPDATLNAAKQVANYGNYGLSGSEMILNV